MVEEVTLEYDFCDIILGKVRHLASEEKQRIELWLRKRVDTIRVQYQLAVLDYNELENDILEKGVFEAYWASIEVAKKYVDYLLSNYVMQYEPVPIINV